MKARLLRVAEMNAVVDVVERLGQRAISRVDLVRRKELRNLVTLFDRAETSCCAHDMRSGVRRKLGMNLFPVLLDVLPGLLARIHCPKKDGNWNPAVLIANLPGDRVVKGARDQRGITEVCQSAQRIRP